MSKIQGGDPLLPVLRDVFIDLVRNDGPDLTARQLSVFLITYLEAGPHTVRGLAVRLGTTRPAITRSVDRLECLGLSKREEDPGDRRSVLIGQTRKGRDFLAMVKTFLPKDIKLLPQKTRKA